MSDETTASFTTPPAETAAVLVPGYALGEEVGRGGMGVVYRARDVALDREVAVKLLQERYPAGSPVARRFLDEARITGQLQHPGIPPIHQAGTLADGRPFLVMKLIKGRTLDRVLEDPGTTNVLAVFEAVCQAVGYAHARGVIHRDLKPGNVMVGAFGEVQVMDWGLAKTLASRERPRPEETLPTTEIRSLRQDETHAGTLLGTPAYLAPEQAAGEVDKVDARADVFGLGAILCVVLTGRPPFTAESADAVRIQAMRGDTAEALARLAGCGAEPGLVELCRRCLSFAPADRPADGGAVATAVGELRRAAEARARQAEVDKAKAEVQAAEERKRRRLGLALAGLVLAGLTLAGTAAHWLTVTRQAASGEAEAALATASDRQEAGQLADALAAARRAEGLLAAAGDPADLRERVAERLAELDLVARLAQIRAGHPDSDDHLATRHLADGQYAAALREAGLDLDAVGTEAAVAWIDDRPALKPYLVAALDDWAVPRRRAKPDDPAGWRLLLDIARKVDPDPWRDRVRDALARGDVPALMALAASADPRGQRATTLNLLGEALVLAGENQAAIGLLRQAHGEYPGDFSVAYLLGSWLRNHGEPSTTEEMVRVTAVAVSLAPDRPIAWVLYARGLHEAGRLDPALAAADRALRLRPESGVIHFHRAEIVAGKGDLAGCRADLARARALLRDRVAAHPTDLYAWSVLGRVLGQLNEPDEAAAAYHQALRDPNYAWPYHNLALLLGTQGRSEESRALLVKAVAINPNSSHIRTALANARAAGGDLHGAIADYEAAIRSEPWYSEAYSRLADLLQQEGRNDEARSVREAGRARCEEILRHRPSDWAAHRSLGNYHGKVNDPDRAAHHYRRAIDLNPVKCASYGGLGQTLLRLGLLDEAVASDRRWARTPTEFTAQCDNDLAFHLMEKGAPLAEAHEALRRALAINPTYDLALLTQAEVYRAEGRFAESLAAYRNGHEIHQKKARQKWPTAAWVKQAERKVELDQHLPDVLAGKLKPASAAEAVEFALVCYYKGAFADAAHLYQDAFTADPTLVENLRADHRYLAARAASKAGDRKQALDWLRADLALWQEQARSDKPADRLAVRCKLNHWRTHDDLIPVRDEKALAALSDDERKDWKQLWADVADLLDRLKPPPIKD